MSRRNTCGLPSTASVAWSRKNPSGLCEPGTVPPGFGPSGHPTAGGVVSTTVIVPVPVPVLPAASVAVQVVAVTPSGKRLPDGGTQVGVSGPSTLSSALAAYVTVAP